MKFGILGPVEAYSPAGDPVAVGGPRPRSLLAVLLVDAGRVVGVDRIVDALYGAEPPGDAANAVQSQVSRLRRKLRDGGAGDGLIEFHPAGYRLAVDPDDVDAHRFARLAREGKRALAEGAHARAAALLREALGLWRSTPLADAPVAETEAARLEDLRLDAVEDRTEAELALGDASSRISELRALVAANPLRERLRGLLMRALAASGRQAEALAEFDEIRTLLADELGADPSQELAAAHLAVLRAEPSATPPARRGLSAQLTSFVGRGGELDRIGSLLATTRLVTLTGPGGAGKTRLAIEAANREPGEVCFVDLSPVADGTQVPRVVLGALGLRESTLLPSAPGQPDVVDRLVSALTDRTMLLILDNCEQVVADVAALAHRLLDACPGLRLLTTSREALGITGESLCPLPPLPMPSGEVTPAEAAEYPAVRLFADRAAAVSPDFALGEGNLRVVLHICHALDGLPLAIELAAARVRSLAPADLAARLDDRFRLLSKGSRTAAPRHQTLRSVVEWSWDLLDDEERRLAARLTVFAGGATLSAVERICGTADLLTGLVEKSLVEVSDGRYRMLETVRAFCAERLAESGEEQALLRAHAEYFLELGETADPHLRRAEQLEWLARLAADNDNLQAALRWAIGADVRLALRLVGALSGFWFLRGLRGGIAPLCAELLAKLDEPGDLAQEYVLCVLNARTGGAEIPDAHIDRCAEIVNVLDRPPRQPYLVVLWALFSGPPSELEISEERQLLQFGDDPWFAALGHFSDGFFRLFRGAVAEADPEFAPCLDLFRSIGDRWGMAQALDALATTADWRGDHDRALALTDEALGLVGELGALEEQADLRSRRASRLLHAGELDAAAADFRLATDLARRVGTPATNAAAQYGLGEVARLRGDLAEAAHRLRAALALCRTDWVTESLRSTVLTALGRLAEAEGDLTEARARHHQALAVALTSTPAQTEVAGAAEGLAGLALAEGDAERAAFLLGTGVAVRGTAVAGDPDVARVTENAVTALGAAGFDAAHARGAALDRAAALTVLEQSTVDSARPS